VLEDLLEMAQEERLILISGRSGELEGVVRSQLRELSKLGSIEKKRAALNPAISAELGLPEKDITVSAIIIRAEPEQGEKLKELQSELTALITEHTSVNMENRELIRTHQEYTEAMLEMIVDSEDPLNNFYGGDGKSTPERKKTTGFFDGHA